MLSSIEFVIYVGLIFNLFYDPLDNIHVNNGSIREHLAIR